MEVRCLLPLFESCQRTLRQPADLRPPNQASRALLQHRVVVQGVVDLRRRDPHVTAWASKPHPQSASAAPDLAEPILTSNPIHWAAHAAMDAFVSTGYPHLSVRVRSTRPKESFQASIVIDGACTILVLYTQVLWTWESPLPYRQYPGLGHNQHFELQGDSIPCFNSEKGSPDKTSGAAARWSPLAGVPGP
ncbi:hypothetical protein N657DRAFT_342952 [Parathielavia appendiculata]|uniref:Uncharacterized protein n=1 Tax=Parathielavia appendiculata TaxID=2587402 RepID=A0AAN6U4I4_9PEZI|nr:hypothetical protein N657DRAFT_342952 [Parathielavia appendiculata]